MNLFLIHGGTYYDKTDYVQSVRIAARATSLIQEKLPKAEVVIKLSQRVEDVFTTGDEVQAIVGQIVSGRWTGIVEHFFITKITKGAIETEIRADRGNYSLVDSNVKGRFNVTKNFLSNADTSVVDFDPSLLSGARSLHIDTQDDIILGMANTAGSKSMVANGFKKPWLTRYDWDSDSPMFKISQLQTKAEFLSSPKRNVTLYKIKHDDVVSSEEVLSDVSDYGIKYSSLGSAKQSAKVNISLPSGWSDMSKLKMMVCESDGTYAVGVAYTENSQRMTRLILSDGTEISATGDVLCATSDYYITVVVNGSQSLVSLNRISDGTQLSGGYTVLSTSLNLNYNIMDNVSVHARTVKIRSTASIVRTPGDVHIFGTTQLVGSSVVLGFAWYRDGEGSPALATISAQSTNLPYSSWLVQAYEDNGKVVALFANQYGISKAEISYNGIVSNVVNIATSSSYTVYPTTAIKSRFYGSDYWTGTVGAVISVEGSTRFATKYISSDTTSLTWSSYGIYEQGWVETNDSEVCKDENEFSWWKGNTNVMYSKTQIDGIVRAIVSYEASVVVKQIDSTSAELLMYNGIMPQNEYSLIQRTLESGNAGEGYMADLSHVLSGADKALTMIPGDKTVLRVSPRALTMTSVRPGAIKLTANADGARANPVPLVHPDAKYSSTNSRYFIRLYVKTASAIPDGALRFFFKDSQVSLGAVPATGDNWFVINKIIVVNQTYMNLMGSIVLTSSAASDAIVANLLLVDLVATFGARGASMTFAQCLDEVKPEHNIIMYPSMNDAGGWSFYNAEYYTPIAKTSESKVNNDTFILPQIGSPIVYEMSPGVEVEGVILGFEYEYDGGTQLFVDILILGDSPQPWSNAFVGTMVV